MPVLTDPAFRDEVLAQTGEEPVIGCSRVLTPLFGPDMCELPLRGAATGHFRGHEGSKVAQFVVSADAYDPMSRRWGNTTMSSCKCGVSSLGRETCKGWETSSYTACSIPFVLMLCPNLTGACQAGPVRWEGRRDAEAFCAPR